MIIESLDDNEYWDQTLIKDILADIDSNEKAVLIAGAYRDDYDSINTKIKNAIVFITSDEENKFDIDRLEGYKRLYVSYPNFTKHKNADGYIPIGYTPNCRRFGARSVSEKNLNWCFSGQVNHAKRRQMYKAISSRDDGVLIQREGFAKGEQNEFYELLSRSKVALAPSGPCSPDSFRLYEALELGCIPIVDDKGFFDNLDVKVPYIRKWTDVHNLIDNYKDRTDLANRVFADWQIRKRKIKKDIERDLGIRHALTVIIPTSPIQSHPDTTIIEATIDSIREHLPDVEVLIMIDGVRDEQSGLTAKYREYTRRLLWLLNYKYKNVYPVLFDEFSHQSRMTRETLLFIDTPYLMFAEHDTPICDDIDFENILRFLEEDANVVRLHFESVIPKDHEYMMMKPVEFDGIKYIPTAQWSQRPHIAKTDFYMKMMFRYFSDSSRTMIEDKVHGQLLAPFVDKGRSGWSDWRVYIYNADDMKHSLNLDGRGSESKYDMIF